eukprot:3913264-Prymnesium_polylepis.1
MATSCLGRTAPDATRVNHAESTSAGRGGPRNPAEREAVDIVRAYSQVTCRRGANHPASTPRVRSRARGRKERRRGRSTEDGRGSPAAEGDHWTDITGRVPMTAIRKRTPAPTLLPPGGTHSAIARRRGARGDEGARHQCAQGCKLKPHS